MIAYLDTHVALFLSEARKKNISRKAEALLRTSELLISPMVLLELEYLHEIGRASWSSRDTQSKLEHEAGVKVCTLPFSTVARIAVDEKWTRDSFDRLIVSQAKANGFAFLISADEHIAKHYPRTIW